MGVCTRARGRRVRDISLSVSGILLLLCLGLHFLWGRRGVGRGCGEVRVEMVLLFLWRKLGDMIGQNWLTVEFSRYWGQ